MKTEYVYFIKINKICKIGTTADLKGRVRAIRTGNPDCEVLGVIAVKDGRSLEQSLHSHFRDIHYSGEFFRMNVQLQSFVRLHVRKSKENYWKGFNIKYLSRYKIRSNHKDSWIFED